MVKNINLLLWLGMGLLLAGFAAPAGAAVSGGPLSSAPAGPQRPESVVIMGVPVIIERLPVDEVAEAERVMQRALANVQLNEATISRIARDFGLLNVPAPNRHLGMLGGDIGFWAGEVRKGIVDRDRLLAEFAARKLVLQTAAANRIFIPTQGDLAAAAQPLMGYFLNQLP